MLQIRVQIITALKTKANYIHVLRISTWTFVSKISFT